QFAFVIHIYNYNRTIHSFPTRRSSDLRKQNAHDEQCQAEENARPGEPGGPATWSQRTPLRIGVSSRHLERRARLKPTPGIPHKPDRKSTRLNSSHVKISYAVFCLKKKI